jgi:hypothetical protein
MQTHFTNPLYSIDSGAGKTRPKKARDKNLYEVG